MKQAKYVISGDCTNKNDRGNKQITNREEKNLNVTLNQQC